MLVSINDLSKTYPNGLRALDRVNLQVAAGEMVALIGASGSGKSTLLRHVAGLLAADVGSGSIRVNDQDVQCDGRINRDIRATRAQIGFVFQQFNLVGRLPLLTNVMSGGLSRMPLWRSCLKFFSRAEKQLALNALARVGIAEHAYRRASLLSGGQQQRAAIARTIVQQAKIVLADEPIASLDPESARRVMQTLADLNTQDGTTVVVSLHQVDVALRFCQRTVALRSGRVVYDGPSDQLSMAMLRDLYGAEAHDILGSSDQLNVATAMPPSKVPLSFSTLPAVAAVA